MRNSAYRKAGVPGLGIGDARTLARSHARIEALLIPQMELNCG